MCQVPADDDTGGGVLDAAYRPGPATNQEIPTMRQRFATLTAAALMLALLVPVASVSAASAIHVHHGQSIQAAINGAPAGSVIYVAPGTYQGNLEVARSVHLIGDHVVVVPAAVPTDNFCLTPGFFNGVVGICVHGSITTGEPVSNVSIEGFTVRKFGGPGIVALIVDGFRAVGVVTAHNGEMGMYINMVSNLSLLDNRSYDNGGDGIFLENLPEGSPSANAVVTGNKSYGNLGSGIMFLNSVGGRIASNDLHGNCAGILVAAADTGFGTTTSGDVSVQRNQVTANNRLCPAVPFQMPAYGGIGIALIGAQNTTVELNVVRNNRSQAGSDIPGGGIVLLNGNIFGAAPPTGNSIRSNRLSGNTPYDIYCDGSGTLNSVSENSGSHSGC